VSRSGLTVTEQFLSQVCNAQSARFNGQALTSSLLQNSGQKTDNALICCTTCLASVSARTHPALLSFAAQERHLHGGAQHCFCLRLLVMAPLDTCCYQ